MTHENGHHDLSSDNDEPEQLDHDEIFTVNNCNGSRDLSIHATDCGGDCGTEDVTGLQIELHNELQAWIKAGMHPAGIMIEQFDQALKLDSLISYLIEAEEVDEDELNQRFRALKLRRLREIRLENEQVILQQRIAVMKSPLFGPDGKPIGM